MVVAQTVCWTAITAAVRMLSGTGVLVTTTNPVANVSKAEGGVAVQALGGQGVGVP